MISLTLVHADLALLNVVLAQTDEDSVLPALAANLILSAANIRETRQRNNS